MGNNASQWLDDILKANESFQKKIDPERMPPEHEQCPYAVITCMDPRINLEAVGISPFTESGEIRSHIKTIRTLAGAAENRALLVGIHVTGFKEIAVIYHTDCGAATAYKNAGALVENLEKSLSPERFAALKSEIGEPFRDNLIKWLKAFDDPVEAVKQEVASIKSLSFVPDYVKVHGLVYDISTGKVEVVVEG